MPRKKAAPPIAPVEPAVPPAAAATPAVPTEPAPPPAPTPAAPPKEKTVEKELKDIYSELGDEGRDMTTLEQASGSTAKKILVGLTVFFAALAAVAWTGFFMFSPGREKFSGEKVVVDIQGPAEPKSGAKVDYKIVYKNGESIPLGTAVLAMRLPKDFALSEAEPAGENLEWKIGSVAPGKEGAIELHGVFTAPLKTPHDLQAILTYRPADFNSEFQKVTTRPIIINDSVYDLSIKTPEKTLPGEKVTVTAEYGNGGAAEAKNLVLRFEYPQGFIPDAANPKAADDGFSTWNLPTLAPGTNGKVTVTGTFASEAKGELDIKAELLLKAVGGDLALQKNASAASTVIGGELVTALIMNGKTGDQAVDFGDTLRLALTYRNTGDVLLEDVSLALVFETEPSSKVLLWNSLKDPEGGVRDGSKLTWTKKQISALGSIKPGSEGSIDIEVPILPVPQPGTEQALHKVSAWIEAAVGKADGVAVSRVTKSQPVAAKMQSDSSLAAQARYFDADQVPVGTGPLPPKVGETTVYRVTWKIANTLHELSDLKVGAALPPNVMWTGQSSVDAGTLRFDAGSERMVWTLNRMPTSVKALQVHFDVSFTPGDDQRGKIATILEGTAFEAIDKVTAFSVLVAAPPLTTMLDGDPTAEGKGRVE
ncbi:hypothetical protein HY633_01630 [Candidatus Uhrbacteria bacterium]|nr:hypothetical protein [Candidatus Uhrbacteria bacterium]